MDCFLYSFNQEVKSADYNYRFDTSNGIFSQASGVGGVGQTGSSQYYAPDGTRVHITYTADEHGYKAEGSHIPTPPPTPSYILQALEHNRLNPQEDDSQQENQQNQLQLQPNQQISNVQTAQQFQQAGNVQNKAQSQYTTTPDGGTYFQYNTQQQFQHKYQQHQQTHYTIQQNY